MRIYLPPMFLVLQQIDSTDRLLWPTCFKFKLHPNPTQTPKAVMYSLPKQRKGCDHQRYTCILNIRGYYRKNRTRVYVPICLFVVTAGQYKSQELNLRYCPVSVIVVFTHIKKSCRSQYNNIVSSDCLWSHGNNAFNFFKKVHKKYT